MKKTIFFLLILWGAQLAAQERAWVFLPNETARLGVPALSDKALERRERAGIALHPTDFALDPAVVQAAKAEGLTVLYASRWLGALAVQETQPGQLVAFAQKQGAHTRGLGHLVKTKTINTYGQGQSQVALLNGQDLHNKGYWGQGMTIAVLDGGFAGVQLFGAFDSLWTKGRILGTKDFVDGDTNVYQRGGHGMSVLSVMGANLPGVLVGVAPRANYWLLSTEDETSETIQEEYNWIAGAEFADSVGADIINSSLGYSTFDDTLQNHTYADLDGKTTPVTLGALWAARKGILVVNSAGNEGSSSWKYILAPADADSILAVGGCDLAGNYVLFSSQGPSADGRIKPDVMAPALNVDVVNSFGGVGGANGTSFASPLIAGLAACLWQAHPGKTAQEIRTEIIQSAHLVATPDPFRGHGIPDFWVADYALNTGEWPQSMALNIYPNPAKNGLFQWDGEVQEGAVFEWVNMQGQVVHRHVVSEGEQRLDLSFLAQGNYVVLLDKFRIGIWVNGQD